MGKRDLLHCRKTSGQSQPQRAPAAIWTCSTGLLRQRLPDVRLRWLEWGVHHRDFRWAPRSWGGSFLDAAGVQHGLVGPADQLTQFDVPGSTSTNGEGINDLGTLVGSFTDAAGATHAFVKRLETFTQFDFPGGHDTVSVAVNNRDEIVGLFTDS